jgi:Na+-translocating ferredoxin:NAD+ oxidoreductase subunit C
MKLFKIRGGVHPDGRKGLAAGAAIREIPLPPLLRIPLQQHIGAPAVPLVKKGDRVLKGQLIARRQGPVSAPIHAPAAGRITAVGSHTAHHPSGLKVGTISLQPDEVQAWAELPPPPDPFTLPPEAIAAKVAEAGIVGLGGATFPSAVKLNLRQRYTLHTLVINGAECEPYLTCDDRLMQEHTGEVLDGIAIMAYALGVGRVVIGIEDNKPAALQRMREGIAGLPAGSLPMQVAGLPARYPMGSEKHLVQALTGRETPARCLTAEIGVVVHNVATALAVHEALRLGRPLVSRVVTLSGGAMKNPGNYRVAIGTPVEFLLEQAGGIEGEPARLISGGPMMGQLLPSTKVPIVKGSNGILALTAAEVGGGAEMPCIRCATCVRACPCGLLPLEMAARIRAGDLEGANRFGLTDCIACGSCAYVCPAHIPLVQFFGYAKGELANRDRARQKQLETKRLVEQRNERLERQKAAKRAALADRKKGAPVKSEAEESEA